VLSCCVRPWMMHRPLRLRPEWACDPRRPDDAEEPSHSTTVGTARAGRRAFPKHIFEVIEDENHATQGETREPASPPPSAWAATAEHVRRVDDVQQRQRAPPGN
jgi:hypothetical protein